MKPTNLEKSGLAASSAENTSKHSKAGENVQNVRKVSEASSRQKVLGKGDARYWMQPKKLYIDARWGAAYSCKIQVNGRRESFPLRSSNRSTAAAKAARIYLDVSALGWDAAMAKHKPDEKPVKSARVGDLIREVRLLAKTKVRPRTLEGNVSAFRRIVAAIHGIKASLGRGAGGVKEWHAQVDAIALNKITPKLVEEWKDVYVATKGCGDEIKEGRARSTVNFTLRSAKSLFAKSLLPELGKKIQLPDELPFHGVKPFPPENSLYMRKMNVSALLEALRNELRVSDPEAFKAAVLSLYLGLRRNEADKLRWSSVNFDEASVSNEVQSDFVPKSKFSIRVIHMEAEPLAILREFREMAPNDEYVLSGRPVNHKAGHATYRADDMWKRLCRWLRKRGIRSQKPIHELRKEAGSLVNERHGLDKAMCFLGHSDIGVTAKHYAGAGRRVTVGIGEGLVEQTAANVITAEFNAAPMPAKQHKRKGAA